MEDLGLRDKGATAPPELNQESTREWPGGEGGAVRDIFLHELRLPHRGRVVCEEAVGGHTAVGTL